MRITAHEIRKLKTGELRRGCAERDGRYYCHIQWKGNLISLGTFDTAADCNEKWDVERKRRLIEEAEQKMRREKFIK